MLLITYKLHFLEITSAYICIFVHLSIYLSIHLPIYQFACVRLDTDTLSSLSNDRALSPLHPSNMGTGNFIKNTI